MTEKPELHLILEAAILASNKPLSLDQLAILFPEDQRPDDNDIRQALVTVSEACAERGFELKQVASGFRFQIRQELAPWIGGLWEEKPQRYTRALLETLALIAYRQPITRGEIEEIRGVSVSSNIVRTLQEREWIRVVGHRDVAGRPAMFATTRQFLDYFNLKNLNDLPTLSEIRDLEAAAKELEAQAATSEEADPAEITEEQEAIEERSAQELFEELDAMEADLPEGFDDMIKKQKVNSLDLGEEERNPSPVEPLSAPGQELSAPEQEPSAPEQEPSAPEQEPSAPEQEPSAPEQEPSAPEQEPSAYEQAPSSDPDYEEEPVDQNNVPEVADTSDLSNPVATPSIEPDETFH